MVKNEELRGQNQVFDSELIVIKKEILKERKAQQLLQRIGEEKDKVNQELKGKLIDEELECSDRQQRIDRLFNQKLLVESKLQEAESSITDKDEEIKRLNDANKDLKSKLF